jgi:hypothetical protein
MERKKRKKSRSGHDRGLSMVVGLVAEATPLKDVVGTKLYFCTMEIKRKIPIPLKLL